MERGWSRRGELLVVLTKRHPSDLLRFTAFHGGAGVAIVAAMVQSVAVTNLVNVVFSEYNLHRAELAAIGKAVMREERWTTSS